MTYIYKPGAVRWKKLTSGDPRAHRPSKGWDATADLVDRHPVTGREFKVSQWWIREVYLGGQ